MIAASPPAIIAIVEFISDSFESILNFFIKIFHSIGDKIESFRKNTKDDIKDTIRNKKIPEPIEPLFYNAPNEGASPPTEGTNFTYLNYIIFGIISGVVIYLIYKNYPNGDSPGDSTLDFKTYFHSLYETISTWARSAGNVPPVESIDGSPIGSDDPIQIYPETTETGYNLDGDQTPKAGPSNLIDSDSQPHKLLQENLILPDYISDNKLKVNSFDEVIDLMTGRAAPVKRIILKLIIYLLYLID